jgi:hypothetical protein
LAGQQAPGASINSQLAAYTGVAASVWQASFGLNEIQFRNVLLPNQVIGREDTRVAVAADSPFAADGGDPTNAVLNFGSVWMPYLNNELKYSSSSTYVDKVPLTIASWSHTHNGAPLPDVIPDLAGGIAQNPSLKIISLNGYYDLTTPFYQTEMDLARLGTNPNIQINHYAGGHETFLDNAARPLIKTDLTAFFTSAITAH